MPPKRRRTTKDTLTGGTGDVNPQLLSGSAPQTASDAYATTEVALPVTRVPSASDVTIIEVLKVYVTFPSATETATTEAERYATISFSTKTGGTTAILFSDASTFAQMSIQAETAFTAGGTYDTVRYDPVVYDCTDGAGHGILVATDKMYVQFGTTAWNTAAQTAYWKILYRFKTVGILEYVGIVQSQQ